MFAESMTSRDFVSSVGDYLNRKNIARVNRTINTIKKLFGRKG